MTNANTRLKCYKEEDKQLRTEEKEENRGRSREKTALTSGAKLVNGMEDS